MRILGLLIALLGVALFVLSVMSWRELRDAATSGQMPSAEAMPLTRIIYPRLFEIEETVVKPAELARDAFGRISLIGTGSLVLLMIGVVTFVLSQRSQAEQRL
ncbi:MAG: hypothetical protein KDA85_09900 [Planctomycetaceae bacterium]|nr:hypothetical protein [Planctomycetaceae bacterium]